MDTQPKSHWLEITNSKYIYLFMRAEQGLEAGLGLRCHGNESIKLLLDNLQWLTVAVAELHRSLALPIDHITSDNINMN